MINVCHNCGEYRADKTIDPTGPFAICPVCRHKHPFRQLPLLIICGPSGTGKTTICNRIAGTLKEVIMLDADILWRPEFDKPETHYRDFYETWLRLGKNIGQSGRPLVLFNAGAIPNNIEPCIERCYYSAIHYLALTCDDKTLIERLTQRPAWRQSDHQQFIEEQIRYNRWFRERSSVATPKVELFDTTDKSVATTTEQVVAWISGKVS